MLRRQEGAEKFSTGSIPELLPMVQDIKMNAAPGPEGRHATAIVPAGSIRFYSALPCYPVAGRAVPHPPVVLAPVTLQDSPIVGFQYHRDEAVRPHPRTSFPSARTCEPP